MLKESTNKRVIALLNSVDNLEIDDGLDEPIRLPAMGSWPQSTHRIDKKSVLAIVAAISANRPLLIKGEPGVGKSQLARAAAVLLQRHFLSAIVQPHSEYQDLMWTIDHTARLGDAQLMGSLPAAPINEKNPHDKRTLKPQLPIGDYISPGPLWWAYDWVLAERQPCHFDYRPEPEAEHSASKQGVVLLLDEIDKADLSLTNGLLEVLGNGSFSIPHLGASTAGAIPPVVIVTSNNTRELPKAFLRRCVIHEVQLPKGSALTDYFTAIGQSHFPALSLSIIELAAEQIIDDRQKVREDAQVKTGLAEYVDLLRALSNLPESQQEAACLSLANYFFKRES